MYYNPELLTQLSLNSAVRVASEKTYQDSYDKMREAYERGRDKLAQIITIQQMIYRALFNVNEGLKQGKKVEYIFEDFQSLLDASGKMLKLSKQYPEYVVFTTKANQKIYENAADLLSLISEQALRDDSSWMMDNMERWKFLDEIHIKIRMMYGWCLSIISYLENAKYKPYFRHVNALDNWYSQDRAIVEDILMKYEILTKY